MPFTLKPGPYGELPLKGPMSLRSWNCGPDGTHVNNAFDGQFTHSDHAPFPADTLCALPG